MNYLLARHTTETLKAALAAGPCVALVPVGSVEPHGPHLPLGTDTMIGEAAAARAVPLLKAEELSAFVTPSVPYGVTEFAAGFAGAISIPAEVLTAFLRALIDGYSANGFAHICLVNNHLEPVHDAAVRAAISGYGKRASVATPLSRRWARTLSDEFKSGACHAGQYETSLICAAQPEAVDPQFGQLPDLTISLSDEIKKGQTRFAEMGMNAAYTGAPRAATAAEGHDLLDRLAKMIATEVLETFHKGPME